MENEELNLEFNLDAFAPTVLAPRLKKPGLHLCYPSYEFRKITDLFQDGTLGPEIFAEFGFVIIDGYPIDTAAEGEEVLADLQIDAGYSVGGLNQEQSLHRDKKDSDSTTPILGVLSLRFPTQPFERPSYTVVAGKEEAALKTFEFLSQQPKVTLDDPLVDEVYQKLLHDIDQYGTENVGKVLARAIPFQPEIPWAEAVSLIRLHRYPQLTALNEALKLLTFECKWRPGRVLLVDNESMVHGRRVLPGVPKGAYLLRCFLRRDASGNV